jgi:hypothetical protein
LIPWPSESCVGEDYVAFSIVIDIEINLFLQQVLLDTSTRNESLKCLDEGFRKGTEGKSQFVKDSDRGEGNRG